MFHPCLPREWSVINPFWVVWGSSGTVNTRDRSQGKNLDLKFVIIIKKRIINGNNSDNDNIDNNKT